MSCNDAMTNARTSSCIGYLLSVNWRPEPRVDTVHAWVVPSQHRSRSGARQVLADAGAYLLGTDPSQIVVSRDSSGRPAVEAATGQVWVSLSYGPGVLAVAPSLAGPVGLGIGLRGAGLQRGGPLPPVTDGSLQALPDGLWLAHPPVRTPLVLAVATS